jgi:hypothetical protein
MESLQPFVWVSSEVSSFEVPWSFIVDCPTVEPAGTDENTKIRNARTRTPTITAIRVHNQVAFRPIGTHGIVGCGREIMWHINCDRLCDCHRCISVLIASCCCSGRVSIFRPGFTPPAPLSLIPMPPFHRGQKAPRGRSPGFDMGKGAAPAGVARSCRGCLSGRGSAATAGSDRLRSSRSRDWKRWLIHRPDRPHRAIKSRLVVRIGEEQRQPPNPIL